MGLWCRVEGGGSRQKADWSPCRVRGDAGSSLGVVFSLFPQLASAMISDPGLQADLCSNFVWLYHQIR